VGLDPKPIVAADFQVVKRSFVRDLHLDHRLHECPPTSVIN